MIKVKIIKDSVSPIGPRLTTFECTYPRFIHSEVMTHRDFSRNASSSRAIPVDTLISRVENNPAIPVYWGKNQKGMQARNEILDAEEAERVWLVARDSAVASARLLQSLGLHKQLVNRVIEPFSHITTLISATNWNNFFALRCHPDAQPEIKVLAEEIRDLYNSSSPELVKFGSWHLPYVTDDTYYQAEGYIEDLIDSGTEITRDSIDYVNEVVRKISVARAARVSYTTQDGQINVAKDIELYNSLLASGHMSPFEHTATPLYNAREREGNFQGWRQLRKTIPTEYIR